MTELEGLKESCAGFKALAFERKRALDAALMARDVAEYRATRPETGDAFRFRSFADGLELFLEVRDGQSAVPIPWTWRIVHRAYPDLSESFIHGNRFINVAAIRGDPEPGFIEGIRGVMARYRAFLEWGASLEQDAYRGYYYIFEGERKYAEAADTRAIVAEMSARR